MGGVGGAVWVGEVGDGVVVVVVVVVLVLEVLADLELVAGAVPGLLLTCFVLMDLMMVLMLMLSLSALAALRQQIELRYLLPPLS